MRIKQKKLKYERWNLDDSLTKEEDAVRLREELSRIFGVEITSPKQVRRLLERYKQMEERGLIQ